MAPEEIVASVFGVSPSQITGTTSNQTLAEWDSLGHMNLIVELESRYGVSFSPEEALAMTSVDTIKRALANHGIRW
jgi:acyl carrier protein